MNMINDINSLNKILKICFYFLLVYNYHYLKHRVIFVFNIIQIFISGFSNCLKNISVFLVLQPCCFSLSVPLCVNMFYSVSQTSFFVDKMVKLFAHIGGVHVVRVLVFISICSFGR